MQMLLAQRSTRRFVMSRYVERSRSYARAKKYIATFGRPLSEPPPLDFGVSVTRTNGKKSRGNRANDDSGGRDSEKVSDESTPRVNANVETASRRKKLQEATDRSRDSGGLFRARSRAVPFGKLPLKKREIHVSRARAYLRKTARRESMKDDRARYTRCSFPRP